MTIEKPNFQAIAAKEFPTADRIELKKYQVFLNLEILETKPLEGNFCNKAKTSALNVAKCVLKAFTGFVTPFFSVWVAISNLFAKIENKHIDAGNKIMLGNREAFINAKEAEFANEVAKAAEAKEAKEAAKPLNRLFSFIEHKVVSGTTVAAAAAAAIAVEAVAIFAFGSYNPLCAIENC